MGDRLTGQIGDTKKASYGLEKCVTNGREDEICESGGKDGGRAGGARRDGEASTSDIGTEKDRADSGGEVWAGKSSGVEHDRGDPQEERDGGGQEKEAGSVSGGTRGAARGGAGQLGLGGGLQMVISSWGRATMRSADGERSLQPLHCALGGGAAGDAEVDTNGF